MESFTSLSQAFVAVLQRAFAQGRPNAGRGHRNIELSAVGFHLANVRCRLIDIRARRTPVPFLMSEFLWQTACRDDVDMLATYAPNIARFSADGHRFGGSAYGRRLFRPNRFDGRSQWQSVIRCLTEDPDSRRAVLTLMGPEEDRSLANNDMTCTVALQLLVRDSRVNMVAMMRSNDIMRGLQSDVFFFTMLQELASVELGLELGTYTHFASVAQIYSGDVDWARRCCHETIGTRGEMTALRSNDIWSDVARMATFENAFRTRGALATSDSRPASGYRPASDLRPASDSLPASFVGWGRTLEAFHLHKRSGTLHPEIDWIGIYSGADQTIAS